MSEAALPTDRTHFQFRIRWLMIAVAVAAGVLALPGPFVRFVAVAEAIPAALIALVTLFAPRGRRGAVAFWATAGHGLVLLAWLMIVRSTWFRGPLPNTVRTSDLRWALEIPYLDVILTVGLILPALFLWSIVRSAIRHGEGIERVYALPPIWAATWIILDADPFALKGWIWD